ncbi:MAG: hypothetical protein IT378_09285, partial [Sandaracinaceae bacterium]|nr:hypothetical protein [Sandaracinaceae bacterium]
MGRALFALLLAACDCGSGDHVAELTRKDGSVSRDHAERRESWQAAEPGARFRIGDAVRTAPAATAELSLGARGAKLRLRERTTVRFLRHPQSGAGIEVATGEAEIEAGDQALAVTTQFGDAILDANTRARLTAAGGGRLRLAVEFGRAVLDEHEVRRGDDLTVAVGGAIVDPEPSA